MTSERALDPRATRWVGAAALAVFVVGGCGGTNAATAKPVDSTGGTVAIGATGGMRASIAIPPNALSNTVMITIHEDSMSTDPPTEGDVVGPVIVFGPEGQTFARPVTITIPTTSAADALMTRPLGETTWTVVPGARYDATRRAIVAEVSHFSEFVGIAAATGNGDASTDGPVGTSDGGTRTDSAADGGVRTDAAGDRDATDGAADVPRDVPIDAPADVPIRSDAGNDGHYDV